jgi:FAD-dependent halogenase
MVLVGDTACFVDPVLSSGVHLATYGALLAARAINASLAGTVPEERGLCEFERRYRAEYAFFYKFLRTFYAKNTDERAYFWEAKRLTGSALSDIVAFIELVGGAASGEPVLVAAEDRMHSYSARAGRDEAERGAPAPEGTASAPGGLIPSADGLSWEQTRGELRCERSPTSNRPVRPATRR